MDEWMIWGVAIIFGNTQIYFSDVSTTWMRGVFWDFFPTATQEMCGVAWGCTRCVYFQPLMGVVSTNFLSKLMTLGASGWSTFGAWDPPLEPEIHLRSQKIPSKTAMWKWKWSWWCWWSFTTFGYNPIYFFGGERVSFTTTTGGGNCQVKFSRGGTNGMDPATIPLQWLAPKGWNDSSLGQWGANVGPDPCLRALGVGSTGRPELWENRLVETKPDLNSRFFFEHVSLRP